jgi:hypothetical protein
MMVAQLDDWEVHMRVMLGLATAFLIGSAAIAGPAHSTKEAALEAGDWHRAAELGASASEVVHALQARGKVADAVAGESVVTVDQDNEVDVVAVVPLPDLPAETHGSRVSTANLSGSGFAFGAKRGSIVLYPEYAKSFAATGARARP